MTTSSGGSGTEPSRTPWRVHARRGVDGWEVLDGHGRSIGCFDSLRDAEHVCGCVNGDAGPAKATQVRWVATDTWVGICNVCVPSEFFIGTTWVTVVHRLTYHHRDQHQGDNHGHGSSPART